MRLFSSDSGGRLKEIIWKEWNEKACLESSPTLNYALPPKFTTQNIIYSTIPAEKIEMEGKYNLKFSTSEVALRLAEFLWQIDLYSKTKNRVEPQQKLY